MKKKKTNDENATHFPFKIEFPTQIEHFLLFESVKLLIVLNVP